MESRNRLLLFAIPILVILVGLTVYQYGYVRLQDQIREDKDRESFKIKTLMKYADLVASKPELEKKLAALKETRKAYDSKLIEGQTLSIAAASLQNNIKALITSKGGTVSSERVEKAEDLDNLKIIGVSIDGTVPDMRLLNEILFSVETQVTSQVVRELDIRVKDFRDPRELIVRAKIAGMTLGK
jgi:hypothetical protein